MSSLKIFQSRGILCPPHNLVPTNILDIPTPLPALAGLVGGSIPLTRCNDVICRHNISIIEDYYSYTIDHQLLWMRCLDDNYFAPAAPAERRPPCHRRPFIQAPRARSSKSAAPPAQCYVLMFRWRIWDLCKIVTQNQDFLGNESCSKAIPCLEYYLD